MCIFCEIISKREKAYIVYENDYVCCFLDKFPINKGHVLIIPKIHYQEFCEVDSISLSEIILAAQKVSQSLEILLSTDGLTIMQNNGIFKDVEHYHMHIIPRYSGDGFSWVEPDIEINNGDFEWLQVKLNECLQML